MRESVMKGVLPALFRNLEVYPHRKLLLVNPAHESGVRW